MMKSVKGVFAEAPTLTGGRPHHFLQPSRHAGSNVTINKEEAEKTDQILLAGFFDNSNEIRLIKRDGTVVNRWPVTFSRIFPDTRHMGLKAPQTDWNIDIHGVYALRDGSVVFNFEYGGLVKLDRCNNVVWALPVLSHHSVEPSQDGGLWVPGQRRYTGDEQSMFPPFTTPLSEDTIMKIAANGAIKKEISVPELFYKNNLVYLLTSTGESFYNNLQWDEEIVHLNKIEELPRNLAQDFSLFDSGDLLLSLRNYNMLLVVDPETETIKWWTVGPWVRQHDPSFKAGGTIVVFNNNIYREETTTNLVSNIIEIDPRTNDYKVIYGGKKGQEMLTRLRGKQEVTIKGGLLITEFEAGRAFETNARGDVIWEFINRYDKNNIAEITEARIYAENYFNVEDWSCM